MRRDLGGPVVSVVVAVSDEETTRIGPLLDSLRGQSHRNLDVVVVPFGRCEHVSAVAREHRAADWRVRLLRTRQTRAGALDAGAHAAAGQALLFADGGDFVLPRGIERLVAAHGVSGSPMIVGRMMSPDRPGFEPTFPFAAAHARAALGTTLDASPVAVTDLGLGNRLITRDLWRGAGLRFTEALRDGEDVALALYRHASAFDLLAESTYIPSGRLDGLGVDVMPDRMSGLEDWIAGRELVRQLVEAQGAPELVDWWLWGVLDTSAQVLLSDVERADDEQWARLRDYLRALASAAGPEVRARLGATARIRLWLVEHDRRADLVSFVASRRFSRQDRATILRDGKVYADVPFRDDPAAPAELCKLAEAETGLNVRLIDARWRGVEAILLAGSVAIDFVHMEHHPRVRCWLAADSGRRIDLPVTPRRDHRANLAARHDQDFSWGGFTTEVPVDRLLPASGTGRTTWAVHFEVDYERVTRSGRLNGAFPRGSASCLGSPRLAPRTISGTTVGFTPPTTGFTITVAPAETPQLERLDVAGRLVAGALAGPGVRELVFSQEGARVVAPIAADGCSFAVEMPAPTGDRPRWSCRAVHRDGAETALAWPAAAPPRLGAGGDVVAARDRAGATELVEAGGVLAVEEVDRSGAALTISGRWLGPPPAGTAVPVLTGDDVEVTGELTEAGAGRCRIAFELTTSAWGLEPRPLGYGSYRIAVRSEHGQRPAVLGEDAAGLLERRAVDATYAHRIVDCDQSVDVELMAPLADDELGPFGAGRLQRWYAGAEVPLDPASVYLQSYAGASATDSQLAIHHELRRVRGDLTLHWGVSGPQSWVPEGGRPVVMGTAEWYRVLASARMLCLNIDPERWFAKRPGQIMVQTFHGYPAKSMGLRMWRAKGYPPTRIEQELTRTSRGWDLILTPAPEMDRYYRQEYGYDGPIHSAGYPRDDLLVSGEADRVRADARRRLGIGPGQRAVLYAPTWRDDLASNWHSPELVRHLDLEAVSRDLGPGFVLLMRGHRFHRARAVPADGARLLDVTDHPEINDLILASDAAVLDYSSLRFDYALTGKPMIFLVPDLDAYTAGVRGFLYDFPDSAPGPLVTDAAGVIEWLRDLEGVRREWQDILAVFNARYNYLQDGRSAERVVRAMLDLL